MRGEWRGGEGGEGDGKVRGMSMVRGRWLPSQPMCAPDPPPGVPLAGLGCG